MSELPLDPEEKGDVYLFLTASTGSLKVQFRKHCAGMLFIAKGHFIRVEIAAGRSFTKTLTEKLTIPFCYAAQFLNKLSFFTNMCNSESLYSYSLSAAVVTAGS